MSFWFRVVSQHPIELGCSVYTSQFGSVDSDKRLRFRTRKYSVRI